MHVKAQRWGNSLAVRIPKVIADAAGIQERDEMEVVVVDGIIQLRPRIQEPGLDELLAGVTSDNLHSEVDFGKAEGDEAW